LYNLRKDFEPDEALVDKSDKKSKAHK